MLTLERALGSQIFNNLPPGKTRKRTPRQATPLPANAMPQMSAVALARQTGSTLGKFYARLRAAGKPAKVALTDVMRKLRLQMSQVLKYHVPGPA